MDIGTRLREERERLAHTQDSFAALAAIGKRALIHYEKGERSPDAQFLAAIAAAGADVLYAPGLQTLDQMKAVVDAVAPRPVNVVVGNASPLTVAEIAAQGVRRVSIGGALARSAWAGFQQAAQALVEGRFDGFASATPSATLNAFFRADADRR